MYPFMANSYGQGDCPVARALDAIGERWSLLILRDLFRKGPLRFQQFEANLTGAAPNTLSARLKSLEAQGVIDDGLAADRHLHPWREWSTPTLCDSEYQLRRSAILIDAGDGPVRKNPLIYEVAKTGSAV